MEVENLHLRRRRHQRNKINYSPPVIREKYMQMEPFALFFTFFLLLWAYYLAAQVEHRLPTPLKAVDEKQHPGRFIAEYAYAHVKNLTKIGPRPVGSFENEVLAVNLISRELNSIAKRASRSHRITIELQKASGAFTLQFLDGMTNVYKNIQNIVLKIGPHMEAPYSVLMNCHFDTVADSPGGSDNSAGCAVLLEILRVVSTSHIPLKNNIIFLFNGAEENLLEGSHGFITQHKWAKNIKAFINLEACGSGGRELLFQVGPENPWLMEAYSSSVPYPLASTLAQEIFQTGLIPGDTDYRIFRDYGKIPGMDFAWAINGYIYHTKLDNAYHVPLKSLQRTGDNLLPLTLKLANLNYPNESPRHGNLVFFDILGAFMFRVPESSGILINICAVLYSVLVLIRNVNEISFSVGCSKPYYVIHLFATFIITLFSWVLSLLYVHLYSQVIIFLDRCMSWYARPLWLFFLYGLPALWIPAKLTNVLRKWQKEKMISLVHLLSLRIDANQIIWTSAVLITSLFGLRSSIIISCLLLVSTWANSTFHTLRKSSKESGRFMVFYTFIMLFPFVQLSYMINGALLVIIPILGRTGSGHNIEGMLALLACAMFLILFNFVVPIFTMVYHQKRIIRCIFLISIVAFMTLIATPFSFPYSADVDSPAPQRYVIMHVEQVIHGFDGKVISDSGGHWIVDLDVNSPRSVSKIIPQIGKAIKVDTCDKYLYCGLPYLIPIRSMISESHWIHTPKPVVSIPTSLTLNNLENLKDGIRRYSFTALGPDHMSMIISPVNDAVLLSWNFLNETPLSGPLWNNRKTYFVYYSCGSNPEPLKFSLDIKMMSQFNWNKSTLDIALTGHFLHGAHQMSIKLRKLLSHFPPWTVTSGWVATYKGYKF